MQHSKHALSEEFDWSIGAASRPVGEESGQIPYPADGAGENTPFLDSDIPNITTAGDPDINEGRLDPAALREHLDESTSSWIAERFSFAIEQILRLEEEADLYGSLSAEELSTSRREIFHRAKQDLGADAYAAGLFALGLENRLTLAAPALDVFQSGDVLLEVAGQRVFSSADVQERFEAATRKGAAVDVTIFRAGHREFRAVTAPDELGALLEESVSPSEYFASE